MNIFRDGDGLMSPLPPPTSPPSTPPTIRREPPRKRSKEISRLNWNSFFIAADIWIVVAMVVVFCRKRDRKKREARRQQEAEDLERGRRLTAMSIAKKEKYEEARKQLKFDNTIEAMRSKERKRTLEQRARKEAGPYRLRLLHSARELIKHLESLMESKNRQISSPKKKQLELPDKVRRDTLYVMCRMLYWINNEQLKNHFETISAEEKRVVELHWLLHAISEEFDTTEVIDGGTRGPFHIDSLHQQAIAEIMKSGNDCMPYIDFYNYFSNSSDAPHPWMMWIPPLILHFETLQTMKDEPLRLVFLYEHLLDLVCYLQPLEEDSSYEASQECELPLESIEVELIRKVSTATTSTEKLGAASSSEKNGASDTSINLDATATTLNSTNEKYEKSVAFSDDIIVEAMCLSDRFDKAIGFGENFIEYSDSDRSEEIEINFGD